MLKKRLAWSFTLLAVLLLTACAPSPTSPTALPYTTEVPLSTLLPTQGSSVSSTPADTNVLQKKITDLAVADLSLQLRTEADSISVTSVEPVSWPNAALGCPQPDTVYAQGKVPGYRVKLTAGNMEYVYHTDQKGTVILCPESSGDEDVLTTPISPNDTTGGQIH